MKPDRGFDRKVIGIAVVFGLSLWVIDAAVDSLIFARGAFWDQLIWAVSAHELYMRFLMLTALAVSGLFISHMRKQRETAEEATRASDRRFRNFLDNLGDIAYEANALGKMTYVNKASETVTGIPLKDIMGVHYLSLIAEESRKDAQDVFERGLQGESVERELVILNERICQFNNLPLRDGDGVVVGIFGSARDVTERRRMEDALRESEGKLDAMLTSIHDHMSMMDQDLNILWANDTAKRLFGDNIIGKKCYQAFHGRAQPCEPHPCLTLQVFQDDLVHEHETTVTTADGELKWFNCTAHVALRDAQGNPLSVMEISRDVTARKRVERMTHIQRDMAAAVSAVNRLDDGLAIFLDAALEVSGLDCGAVYLFDDSRSSLDIVYHKGLNREFVEATFHYDADSLNARLVTAGQPIYSAYRLIGVEPDEVELKEGLRALAVIPLHHGKEVIGCLNVSSHVFDEVPADSRAALETIAALIGSAIDRLKAQEALRASKQFLQTVIDAVPDVTMVVDRDKKVLLANRAARAVSGGDPTADSLACHEVCHRSAHSCNAPGEPCPLDTVVKTKTATRVTHSHYDSDGGETVVEVSVAPIFDETGEVSQIVEVCRDITEKQRATELLAQRQAELYHVSRVSLMGEMASGLAHEVNQPLGAICAYADALEELSDARRREVYDETVGKIVDQARRASAIVQRFRSFARKEGPHRESIDVNKIIREAISLVEGEAKRRQIAVSLELADQLSPAPADAIQIQQVLLNLIWNSFEALELSDSSARSLIVRSAAAENGTLSVTVQDSGTGLGEEAARRMFDPFYTTKPDGTGLGLSISRRIIEEHGGRLWATPFSQREATVCFTLPLEKGTAHVRC